MIPLVNLEIHVSHACNLSCQQCSHYSNAHHRGMVTVSQADQEMGLWSQRLAPKMFSLLGGEPAVNPQLPEIVELAKRHWPASQLQLVTNGFLLPRHPELPEVLESTGCRLEISIHHESENYQQRLEPVRQLVADWQSRYKLQVNWRPSSRKWRRAYRGEGASMLPYADNNQRQSWEKCPAKRCPQIHAGKLWKCAQLAYLPMQLAKFNLTKSEPWQPYLSYEALPASCTDAELKEFVSRKDETACGMCPANPELFELPNPLRAEKR